MIRENSKVDRISLHARELIKEFQSWLDLRVQLAGFQYWDLIQQNRKTIFVAIATAFTCIISIIFMLIAAALGLGILLGHQVWGFVCIGGAMGVCTGLLYRAVLRQISKETVTNGQTEPESALGNTGADTTEEGEIQTG